jgi:hypothetical protein
METFGRVSRVINVVPASSATIAGMKGNMPTTHDTKETTFITAIDATAIHGWPDQAATAETSPTSSPTSHLAIAISHLRYSKVRRRIG